MTYSTSAASASVVSGRRRPAWAVILITGLILWLATVAVTFATANANLVPTLVLLGSFLVPVTFVAWAYSHRDEVITVEALFRLFIVGGILGVLGASILETYLLHPSVWMFVGVGLIEEGVKLAALWLLTRHLAGKSVRSGVVLGATVGFGFAAFESAGYALNALITVDGLSLRSLVETEILRGLLAPFGHGLWTAILGGLLFATAARATGPGATTAEPHAAVSHTRHFRLTGGLVLGYLGVALLHALWDSMHGIAVYLTWVITSTAGQQALFERGWIPQPTDEQVHLFTLFSIGGTVLITLIALYWLRRVWRAGRHAA
ncbi:PrsW family intramembrane metalloprotease [Paractinoplanes atraurantiacus]|uniref:Membrane proteinase PrsW, cleaves anti-sigma factor RsiW, M82 family n=1 Tax=Paractinoplanes atraurantiacus TaxID=1036182 RepID=A0A285HWX5_9ACTN|nr:PrsW family glutamic-type intramembrane protease [Actinoplanes atraurantiacus]SNY40189.1 Membrane proteinase PrsW, cleaves anti-sigma factor RsiW, M82 family [Actinoplanes atraurantiacus]